MQFCLVLSFSFTTIGCQCTTSLIICTFADDSSFLCPDLLSSCAIRECNWYSTPAEVFRPPLSLVIPLRPHLHITVISALWPHSSLALSQLGSYLHVLTHEHSALPAAPTAILALYLTKALTKIPLVPIKHVCHQGRDRYRCSYEDTISGYFPR